MTRYIESLLHMFQHAKPTKPINQPHKNVEATHGSKKDYSENPDDIPALNNNNCRTNKNNGITILIFIRN